MSEPSPIDPALLRPVLAPTLGESRTLPAEAYTSARRVRLGGRALLRGRRGSASAAPTTCARRRRPAAVRGRAARASCSCATGRRAARASSTRAGTAARAAGARRRRGTSARSSARTTRGCTASTAPSAARRGSATSTGFDKADYPLVAARVEEWHGWIFVNAVGRRTALAEHVGQPRRLLAAWEPERLFVGGDARLRDPRELEDDHRELPRVLPLPVDPPGAVRGDAARLGRELPARRRRGWAARWC